MENHPTRARIRHGHLPGHIRDAFLSAAEAFMETDPGKRLPRVPFQVRYRDRTISVAEACGLVWHCTDTMPGIEFTALCDFLGETPSRQTYAAAARALLRELRDRDDVNSGIDAKLKRLYDQRDILTETATRLIADEKGLDLTDPLARWQARGAVDDALKRWERRETDEDHPPIPTTPPLELLWQHLYRQCELIKAIEDLECGDDDNNE